MPQRRSLTLPLVVLLACVACGGAVESAPAGSRNDSRPPNAPGTPAPAPQPTPGPVPSPTPREATCSDGAGACDPGETYFAHGTECRDADAICRPTREACALRSFCGRPGPLRACPSPPSCDDGDAEVETCPAGGLCYRVARCGVTIACQRFTGKAVPCEIGDREVDSEADCKTSPGCYSAGPSHKGDVWYSIWCVPG